MSDDMNDKRLPVDLTVPLEDNKRDVIANAVALGLLSEKEANEILDIDAIGKMLDLAPGDGEIRATNVPAAAAFKEAYEAEYKPPNDIMPV